MSHYDYSGSNRRLSADEVREKDDKTQIDIMREWFNYNFDDPNKQTPHVEGEFVDINGGTYDPYNVLRKEFYDIVPNDVIDILTDELCQIQIYWAPAPHGNYSDDTEDDPFWQFDSAMRNIDTLSYIKLHNTHSKVVSSMYGLLYANIIIALEVYLSDTFKNKVIPNDSLTRRFVETTLFFKEKEISISDIYNNKNGIKNRVNNCITKFSWHRLKETKEIYENTLDIKFPEDMAALEDAILIRHDIMHRNGKTKDGEYHKFDRKKVINLMDKAKNFALGIYDETYKFRFPITPPPQTAPEHSPANQNASDN